MRARGGEVSEHLGAQEEPLCTMWPEIIPKNTVLETQY